MPGRKGIQEEEQREDALSVSDVQLLPMREECRDGGRKRGYADKVLLRILRKEVLEASALGESVNENQL